MRFIHASDLHLDSPLRGLDRYEGAPVERLRTATRAALERLVDRALDEPVDFLLLAGDLYDRDWQDFHTGLFFREQMARLNRADIRVFIVQGNHDRPRADLAATGPAAKCPCLLQPGRANPALGRIVGGDPRTQLPRPNGRGRLRAGPPRTRPRTFQHWPVAYQPERSAWP